ncbi:hypothetical protein NQ176_g3660 [Zarea fungicola]|uniref:Uncharacterized protein n=1 Tax=Zarea fungicola TaxID=93591 RepID=A0ACC1NJE6_9HYPO|nr:hypothetical protein NQ176_g3660 [Lecanicillium fungicola]
MSTGFQQQYSFRSSTVQDALDGEMLFSAKDALLIDPPHTATSLQSAAVSGSSDFAGSLREISAASSSTTTPVPSATGPLHVSSGSRMEKPRMDKARSQCLRLCGEVTTAFDSVAEKMSDYTTLATHLPRGFVALADEVLGACSELSRIYSGLSDAALPGQNLPGDVIAAIEKKLRGAQGHIKALDQVVTKLLDHARSGAKSRLFRTFGRMSPSDQVEKLKLEATKMREDLKKGNSA